MIDGLVPPDVGLMKHPGRNQAQTQQTGQDGLSCNTAGLAGLRLTQPPGQGQLQADKTGRQVAISAPGTYATEQQVG